MASVAYAIEGSEESLKKIAEAIIKAIHSKDKRYEMYQAAEYLKLPITDGTSLGGEIEDEPELENGVLRFWSEERWGLQDFADLLEEKFTDIKVYWIVEEPGDDIYCTNDKEGKYFPKRFYVDACIDGFCSPGLFETEEEAYTWLDKLTNGRVKSKEDVEKFNADYEDSGTDDENFIYIHEFKVE